MQYRPLGRTGAQVSVACLGTMTFGWDPDDWGSTEEEAQTLTDAALDLGVNFFDTADVYARGQSEKILGKSLKGANEAEWCWQANATARWTTPTPTREATRTSTSPRPATRRSSG